jgi:hypothetical protein
MNVDNIWKPLVKLSRIRVLVAFYQRVANDLSKFGLENTRESGLLGNGTVNNNLLEVANDNLVRFQRM